MTFIELQKLSKSDTTTQRYVATLVVYDGTHNFLTEEYLCFEHFIIFKTYIIYSTPHIKKYIFKALTFPCTSSSSNSFEINICLSKSMFEKLRQ